MAFLFSEEKTIESAADAKTYQQITTSIPPESISVPLILYGILEQVRRFFLCEHRMNASMV